MAVSIKPIIFVPAIERQPILQNAKIAQLVERDLAKVEVAGPSPVFRSKRSFKIALQQSHSRQGVNVGLSYFWQFKLRARILADDVLPTPLVPVSKKAWCNLFVVMAFDIVLTKTSCPTN